MKTRMIITIIILTMSIFSLSVAGNITGKITAHGAKNGADAVIYIEKVEGKTFSAPKEHAKMDQIHLAFKPRVLPVLAGTTVDFLNSDNVLHNVFSPDKCTGKFNLGSWPQGQTKPYTFETAGCTATLLCNVHPEMEGFVVVLSNPYFAVSGQDGAYKIKDVPAGKYNLKIWHGKLKGKDAEVEVPATGDATVNFDIHK